MICSSSLVTVGGKGMSSALGFSSCRCVRVACMPSSCGMLRYSAVTSIVARMMFGGKAMLSKRFGIFNVTIG